MAKPKKITRCTPCVKCGGVEFEQRYHAIISDIGYIADKTFICESQDVCEETSGVEIFKCRGCDAETDCCCRGWRRGCPLPMDNSSSGY